MNHIIMESQSVSVYYIMMTDVHQNDFVIVVIKFQGNSVSDVDRYRMHGLLRIVIYHLWKIVQMFVL